MENSLRNAIIFSFLPAAAVAIGGVMFFYKPPSPGLLGGMRKFAAGALVAVMAVEMLPDFLYVHSVKALLMLAVGGLVMFGLRWSTRKLSPLGWDAVQAQIAGLLIGSGFVTGFREGVLLTAAFAVAALAIGLFAASVMNRRGVARSRAIITIAVLSALIPIGTLIGGFSLRESAGIDLDLALVFGMAAPLLWAVEGLVEKMEEYLTVEALVFFIIGALLFFWLAWWLGAKHSDHPGRSTTAYSSLQRTSKGAMNRTFTYAICPRWATRES